MRLPRPFISLLLATAVLAGQWLAATHDSAHGLSPNASHSCAICVYAHGAGTGALPVQPVVRLDDAAAEPFSIVVAIPVATALRDHPIRGPPLLLV